MLTTRIVSKNNIIGTALCYTMSHVIQFDYTFSISGTCFVEKVGQCETVTSNFFHNRLSILRDITRMYICNNV